MEILQAESVHPNEALSGVVTVQESSPGKETRVVAEVAGDKMFGIAVQRHVELKMNSKCPIAFRRLLPRKKMISEFKMLAGTHSSIVVN